MEGWRVNQKRVERLGWQEALEVPKCQKKRGRLYLNNGSLIRLRPCWQNHVCEYDFCGRQTGGRHKNPFPYSR